MEQAQGVKALGVGPGAVAAGKVAGETVSARIVGKKFPMPRAAPAMNSNAQNAEPP
jgi:hypothetical protein